MKRLAHSDYPVVALTHPGMKGKNNEDSFGVSAYSLEPLGPWPVLLAVLCDGIGGHRAGEVAAELAVEAISREVGKSNAADPTRILSDAIQAASNAVYIHSMSSSQQNGMGATCACAWIIGDKLYTATVGDSRVYLLRNGLIYRLSTDHTWIQEALEKGILKADQINGHPNQHVIRRYLGSPAPPEVDLRIRLRGNEDDQQAEANQGMRLIPGDQILLTSDGLTDLVSDEEIQAAYFQKPGAPKLSVEDAGQNLIDLANQRGGHDNITIVAVGVPLKKLRGAARVRNWAGRNWGWAAGGCAGVLLAAFLVIGLAGGWWWVKRGPLPTAMPSAAPAAIQATDLPTPQAQATAQGKPPPSFLTPTPTPEALFPADSGATLTPWPTNTPGQ
jgi:PPM family protein phosphatase